MATSPQNGATYMIMNLATKTVLDLQDGQKADLTPCIGYHAKFDNSEKVMGNQAWRVDFFQGPDSAGKQWCHLTNWLSNSRLDMNQQATANGTQVQGYTANVTPAQLWSFEPVATGVLSSGVFAYRIWNGSDNRNSGLTPQPRIVLDLNASSAVDFTKIQGWARNQPDTDNQMWLLLPVNLPIPDNFGFPGT